MQRALRHVAQTGQGVLVYLHQARRSIGLLNKLRVYHLQDAGYDTIDANKVVNFARPPDRQKMA